MSEFKSAFDMNGEDLMHLLSDPHLETLGFFLGRHKLLLFNEPMPSPYKSSEFRVRESSIRGNDKDQYSPWHIDRQEKTIIMLSSYERVGYKKQPKTVFSRTDVVLEKILEYTPRLMRQLPFRKDLPQFPIIIYDLLEEKCDSFNASGFHLFGKFGKEEFPYLRAAARGMLSVATNWENNEDVISLLCYSSILGAFEENPVVGKYLELLHEDAQYVHTWQPGQTLLWSSEDTSIMHARIPGENQGKKTPLRLITLEYTQML